MDEPETINVYKYNGQEVKVITGPNPKCPDGYKIIKTNLNDSDGMPESGIKVLICAKEDVKESIIKYNPNFVSMDPVDSLTLDFRDYTDQVFPFGRRDNDKFTAAPSIFNMKSCIVLLLIILIILCANMKKICKNLLIITK